MIAKGLRCLFASTLFALLVATATAAFLARTKGRTEWQPPALYTVTPVMPQGGGYAYRRTITIDHTKVPNSDQSSFPLLISGAYSYLATVSNGGNVHNANGYDVIFTADAGCTTKLDHEVETYNATTGAVTYWVRVPLLSYTNDTTLYLCYGNSAITTNQSNKIGVWDSNFKAVYHLNDHAANTTVTDATTNGSNGINAANSSVKSVSGKFGQAFTYNGSSDNTTTGVTQTSSFTWECWFKLTAWTTQSGSSNYSALMAGVYGSGGALLMLWADSAWLVQFAPDNVGGVTSGASSIAPGTWHHAAFTRTGNNGTYAVYLDGQWKGQVTSGTNNSNSTITLGTRSDYLSQALNGLLDETRISNVARSADWIKTQYNNQSSPTTFYSVSAGSNCCDTSTARLDPLNATGGGGENPLSRNFNWTLPLVNLPGRAAMDLSLSLSYNSLVWTKTGTYISFDDDRGFPGPGFRLGFPVIQPLYFNSEVGKNAFLLIGSDGSRTELRQVNTSSALYEAADSSHLLLDASTMVLRTTDGTQLKYELKGSEYQCTEIKDRNGNYITVNYTPFGRIDTVIDTLGRSIKFNYDGNGWLTSITQIWNQGTPSQVTHNWAIFTYTNTTIQTNFTNLTVSGPSNGSTIKTLSKVTLADSSHYDFTYTSWGQVGKVSSFAADNHLLNYRSYNLPQTGGSAQTDCPRFTERRDWAQYWNGDTEGIAATNEETLTAFATPVSDSWTMPDGSLQTGMRTQITTPDLTFNKMYFIGTAGTPSGWRRGLPALVISHDSNGVWQRKVMTTWTQDNTAVSYQLNPRVTETNTYDPAGNRARVQTTYQQTTFANGTSCQFPRDVYEYAANATTILRSTRTDYHTSTVYTDRRIIGLPTERRLYEGDVNNAGVLMSKVGFFYDNENNWSSIQGTAAPIQHDNTNYTAGFVTGRGNVSSVRRYDVTNTAQFTTTRSVYNTAGGVVSSTDAAGHVLQFSYTDSFSDAVSRNTLAYTTKLTDADSYYSISKYNFDFGALTYRRTPPPNFTGLPAQQPAGPEQTFAYDNIGRLQQVTNEVNGAYTRYVYPNTMTRVDTYITVQDSLAETQSVKFTDGVGRVIATATEHPGSIGGYSGQKFVYDVMGRVIKTSNPTETSASGTPSQWVAAGDDAGAGWIYLQQTYDWKSRPLVATNQDGTTKTVSYSGCGCAGGEVVTLTDEGTIDSIDNVTVRKREKKIYSDVLGRTIKAEILNWEGGSVHSAVVNTFNARDQIVQVRQFAGAAPSDPGDLTCPSGTCQKTETTYDGHGRPKTRQAPEHQDDINNPADTDHTTWDYNADDTIQKITDPRGAVSTFSYNNRHMVTNITYTLSPNVPTTGPSGVASAATVGFEYDAAGNRKLMNDGMGSVTYNYDLLSRLTSETRFFSSLSGSSTGGNYTLSYEYNLANQVTKLTDPNNVQVNYGYDQIGRLSGVTGIGFSVSTFLSNIQYRAWGAPKSVAHVNNRTTATTYDARLRVATYKLLPAVPDDGIKLYDQYEYFPDGRLKKLTDLDDHDPSIVGVTDTGRWFSRVYRYDNLGRITRARGYNLPNNFESDRPYDLLYGYDSFNHLTSRSGKYYYETGFSDSGTFENNQRQGWDYAADGRETRSTGPGIVRDHTYNAAGLMVQSKETVTATSQVSTYVTSYDGDGNLARELLQQDPVNTTSYKVRSSVLGEVVTRLNNVGNKTGTTVPLDKRVTPTRINSTDTGNVPFPTYEDPLGQSIAGDKKAVYDPLGNHILWQSSPQSSPPPFYPRSSASFGSLGSLWGNAQESGCQLDGIPTNCDLAMSLLNNGSAMQCKDNDCGPRFVRTTIAGDPVSAVTLPFMAFGDGTYGSFFGGWDETPQEQAAALFAEVTFIDGVRHGNNFGPQNPGLNPFLVNRIKQELEKSDCAKFAQTILDQLAPGKNRTLDGVFNAFLNQPKPHDLLTRVQPKDCWSEACAIGSIKDSTAAVWARRDDVNQTKADADNIIAELFHFARMDGRYTDKQLANAARRTSYASEAANYLAPSANVFDPGYKPGGWNEENQYGYSVYFHTIQKQHCGFRPPSAWK